MSVFLQPIYSQTLGAGGATSVTFNNIPQGFTDLVVMMSGRCNFAGTYDVMFLQVNGSNAKLSFLDMISTGSGTIGQEYFLPPSGGWWVGTVNGSTTTANTFSNLMYTISNYSSGTAKSILFETAIENNSSVAALQQYGAALWNNPAPITSLSFSTINASTFSQYTSFTLYGRSATYASTVAATPTISSVTDTAGSALVAFNALASNEPTGLFAVTTTPSTQTNYGVTTPIYAQGLTVGTSYTYQVSAINDKGTSTSTASSAVTTTNAYSSIATVALTSGTASQINFANIPQHYTHLQIRGISRSTGGGAEATNLMQVNQENTSYYNTSYMGSNGSAPITGHDNTQVFMYGQSSPSAGSTASVYGAGVTDILDYSSYAKFKTIKTQGGYDANGSGLSLPTSGTYRSISPITSIQLIPSGAFAQYTHFALYGIA
jgi:hypothetical protein